MEFAAGIIFGGIAGVAFDRLWEHLSSPFKGFDIEILTTLSGLHIVLTNKGRLAEKNTFIKYRIMMNDKSGFMVSRGRDTREQLEPSIIAESQSHRSGKVYIFEFTDDFDVFEPNSSEMISVRTVPEFIESVHVVVVSDSSQSRKEMFFNTTK